MIDSWLVVWTISADWLIDWLIDVLKLSFTSVFLYFLCDSRYVIPCLGWSSSKRRMVSLLQDLDVHVGSHHGIIKTQRLLHVAKHCPPLRVDALKLALKQVQRTADVSLYTRIYEDLKNALQWVFCYQKDWSVNSVGRLINSIDWLMFDCWIC